MIIYKATNKINGKAYVGQTVKSLNRRRKKHVSDSLSDHEGSNNYFHRAMLKHGKDSFDWEILIEGDFTIETLNKLEIRFISLCDTYINGYNLTKGGEGKAGCIPSEEARRKLSKAGKASNNNAHKSGKDASNVRPVIINNKHFDTRKGAAKYLNVDSVTVRNRIKRQVPGYQYA